MRATSTRLLPTALFLVVGGCLLLVGILAALAVPPVAEHVPDPEGFWRAVSMVGVGSLAVAFGAGWMAVRDVTVGLRQVRSSLRGMAQNAVQGASMPLRNLDELGDLAWAFDELRDDFQLALERERELRREVEAAEQAKAALLNAVSHELRTPLNAILGFADVLLSELDGPLTESQKEDVAIIRSAGRHLMALFNDVLDLTRAASNQLRLRFQEIHPGPLVRAVAAELRGLCRDKTLEIIVDVPEDLPSLRVDPKRLRQVLTNLSTNAVKYTERGEVRISVAAQDEHLIFTVQDTGVGIAAEEQALAFSEFGRVGEGKKRGAGAGLGLVIARRLTELHGGYLQVESTPGKGSCFTVAFPRELPPETTA